MMNGDIWSGGFAVKEKKSQKQLGHLGFNQFRPIETQKVNKVWKMQIGCKLSSFQYMKIF